MVRVLLGTTHIFFINMTIPVVFPAVIPNIKKAWFPIVPGEFYKRHLIVPENSSARKCIVFTHDMAPSINGGAGIYMGKQCLNRADVERLGAFTRAAYHIPGTSRFDPMHLPLLILPLKCKYIPGPVHPTTHGSWDEVDGLPSVAPE